MPAERIGMPDNNLYRNGYVLYHRNDGEGELLREIITIKPSETDIWHTVVYSDTLDALSARYYKNYHADPSKLWWLIADANLIYNPLDISEHVGTQILIPDYLRIKFLFEN